MHLSPRSWPGFVAASCLVLSGCAGLRTVESEVQTFSSLSALPTQASFKFDRLPSQQPAQDKRAADLEAVSQQALAKVGLRRDDASTQYSVQIGARVERGDRLDWSDNWRYWWPTGGPHFSRLSPWTSPWMHTSPWYQREVSLTIRDLTSGQIVYETHASQEGVTSDTPAILATLFESALADFPKTSNGVKKIITALPTP